MSDPLTPLLRSLDPTDRAVVDRYLVPATFEVGEVVMEQGEDDPVLACVSEGALSIVVDGRALFEVGPGEVAGAEDVFDATRRTFTVTAAAPTSLLLLAADGIGPLQRALPAVARTVELGALRTLARLTGELDRRIVEDAAALHREHDPRSTEKLPLLDELLEAPTVRSRTPHRGSRTPPGVIAALPQPMAALAAELGRSVRFGAGTALLREGEDAGDVHVLARGRVEALGEVGHGVYVRLGTLGPDDVVGIGAALLQRPHAATVVALEATEALHLDRYAFNALLGHDSEAAAQLRAAMLRSMAAWLPGLRDRAGCAAKCLRATLHERLFP